MATLREARSAVILARLARGLADLPDPPTGGIATLGAIGAYLRGETVLFDVTTPPPPDADAIPKGKPGGGRCDHCGVDLLGPLYAAHEDNGCTDGARLLWALRTPEGLAGKGVPLGRVRPGPEPDPRTDTEGAIEGAIRTAILDAEARGTETARAALDAAEEVLRMVAEGEPARTKAQAALKLIEKARRESSLYDETEES